VADSNSTKSSKAEFLSPAEVGQILGIGRHGVYAAIKSGDIRAVRVGPKLLRVPRSALDELTWTKAERGS
jgi:excisionase family DNA binding protein